MISMREAYEKIGANYDDACARLMGEEMLARFALKFLDDESMDKLEAAMAAGMSKPSSSQIYYIDLSGEDSVVVYQKTEGSLFSRLLASLNQGIYAVVEYFE